MWVLGGAQNSIKQWHVFFINLIRNWLKDYPVLSLTGKCHSDVQIQCAHIPSFESVRAVQEGCKPLFSGAANITGTSYLLWFQSHNTHPSCTDVFTENDLTIFGKCLMKTVFLCLD